MYAIDKYVYLDKYVKISRETLGLVVYVHSKGKEKNAYDRDTYCQRRSDDAGMWSVTGRVGIPEINAEAVVFVLELANGTN